MAEIITSPIKAIRAKCLDCMNGSVNEVRICPCTDCVLYPFRFGKNPYHNNRREMTEEAKAKTYANLAKAREALRNAREKEQSGGVMNDAE